MQADIIAVAFFRIGRGSFCPTNGSNGRIGEMEQHDAQARR